jgi:ribosomal protein S27AE
MSGPERTLTEWADLKPPPAQQRPVSFALRYPEGHELAGQLLERKQSCPRCGERFTQQKINPEWLNAFKAHSAEHLKAFLRTCEVDENRQVYIPGRCGKCERAQLNPSNNPSLPEPQNAGSSS